MTTNQTPNLLAEAIAAHADAYKANIIARREMFRQATINDWAEAQRFALASLNEWQHKLDAINSILGYVKDAEAELAR